jgi:NADPH-dependent 2,4-dienoyl-CoA reductase/sulfur reductase-like enzyme
MKHRATERLVVIGGGMAAVRFVEELVARSYAGTVTVLADEEHAPYNRILLSAVLEGTHNIDAITLRSAEWFAERGVDLRLGARVLEVDRDAGEVMLVDGTRIPFDRLVLATGSIPTLPPIRGLVRFDGSLHPRVHAFRSLADCERLDEEVGRMGAGARAVVVGGGLLGLQVARALSIRGLHTEIVEGAEHLLASQLGEPGGRVLARDLRRLGTDVYTGARAIRMTEEGVRLDNGYELSTDLVVLTAGGRPSTALARRAGLMVRRGVVVDSSLRSVTDDRIHAIGDCAEHRRRVTGFVPPAWEQAGVLADVLTGGFTRYDGSRSVARLRARPGGRGARGPRTRQRRGRRDDQPDRRFAPPPGDRGRGDRGRRARGRPVPGRADHPALRPRDRPRSGRTGSAAPRRSSGRAGHAARRGRGLRLRRRLRRCHPGVRELCRVPRVDARDHRLWWLRVGGQGTAGRGVSSARRRRRRLTR